MAPNDAHLEQGIAKAAARGGWIGAASVVAVFVVAIILTGSSMTLMAVAALAAVFGGAPFGAMLGASSVASREPIPLSVRVTHSRRRRG